jgi:hypothetical protein
VSEENALDKVRRLFTESKLLFPGVPEDLSSQLSEVHDKCFSTRELIADPYEYAPYLEEAAGGKVEDYLILAQSNNTLHYYLSRGPLKLLLHLSWIHPYTDEDESRAQLRRCYETADQIVADSEKAQLAGKLKEEDTLLVFGSDNYASGWAKPGENYIQNLAIREMTPGEALDEAAAWLQGD